MVVPVAVARVVCPGLKMVKPKTKFKSFGVKDEQRRSSTLLNDCRKEPYSLSMCRRGILRPGDRVHPP